MWTTHVWLEKAVKVNPEKLEAGLAALREIAVGEEEDSEAFRISYELNGNVLEQWDVLSQYLEHLDVFDSRIQDAERLIEPLQEALEPGETAWVSANVDDDYEGAFLSNHLSGSFYTFMV